MRLPLLGVWERHRCCSGQGRGAGLGLGREPFGEQRQRQNEVPFPIPCLGFGEFVAELPRNFCRDHSLSFRDLCQELAYFDLF